MSTLQSGPLRKLISLFLKDSSPNGVVRRTTFGLMLDFLRHRDGAPTEDPVKEFLASCYTGTLAGDPWTVSGRLEIARRGWALYARNEMLSLAWLTLFKNALDALDGQPKAFATIEGLAAWLISTPAFHYRPPMEVDALIRQDVGYGTDSRGRREPRSRTRPLACAARVRSPFCGAGH
jgi:hypothetical protein